MLRCAFGFATWALVSPLLAAAEPLNAREASGDSLPPGALARMGNHRLTLVGTLKAVAYSADGKWLATQTDGGIFRNPTTTQVWDKDGAEVRNFRTGPIPPGSLHFLHNSSLLISGGQLCDLQTGEVRDAVAGRSVGAVSSDGRVVAIQEGKEEISFFDRQQQVEIGKIKVPSIKGTPKLVLSSDGKLFAVATYDGVFGLWSTADGRQLHDLSQPYGGGTSTLAFSPDGKILAAGGDRGSIRLYDTASGKWQSSLDFQNQFVRFISALAFSADGQWLAAAADDVTVKTWNVGTRRGGRSFVAAKPSREIQCLAFSANGKWLAAGGSNQIRQWEFDTGREIMPPSVMGFPINDLAFSPDGRRLATGSSTGIHLWDATNGRLLKHLDQPNAGKLSFSADGWLLVLGEAGGYRAWETSSWHRIIDLRADDLQRFRIIASCLSTGIDRLCIGNELGKIRLLEIPSGKLLREMVAFEGTGVARIAISPDKGTIAVAPGQQFSRDARRDDSIRLLDARTGQWTKTLALATPTNNFGQFSDLQFSPDGAFVAAVHATIGLTLWTFPRGQQVVQLPSVNGTISYSRDGRLVACWRAGEVIVVETATGEVAWKLPSRAEQGQGPNVPFPNQVARNPVGPLAISPDQSTLAVASAVAGDPSVLCWSMAPSRWKERNSLAPAEQISLETCWQRLAESNAVAAHEAIWTIAAASDEAAALLKKRLTPAIARQVNRDRLKQLIVQLDSDVFQRREDAQTEIGGMGKEVVDDLRKALVSKQTAEVTSRLQNLIRSLESQSIQYPSESVRRMRAVQALERVGTTRAVEALQKLAAGDPAAPETESAARSLERLRSAGGRH